MTEQDVLADTAETALLVVERIVADDAEVAIVTFNRPEQRNPIDKDTIKTLRELVTQLSKPGGPRAIILTGAGGTFSAGGDLKAYQSLYRDATAFRAFMDDFDATCEAIEKSPACVVAMINGTCVAGGLELALACDEIVMAEDARIGDGHLGFAQLPGAGGSQRLVRAIGVQRARHWLLTGKLFDAKTAVESGLAVSAVPRADLLAHTLGLAAEMTRRSPLAIARMKELIRIAQNHPLDEGLQMETEIVHRYATTSHDATEGLEAFADRRPPKYLGR